MEPVPPPRWALPIEPAQPGGSAQPGVAAQPGASAQPSGAAQPGWPVLFPGQGAGAHDRLPTRPGGGPGGAGVSWLERQGGLHNLVRQELVARHLAEQLSGRTGLRVLDVGCGQATQALRLARAGHLVTGLDPDPVTLGAAQAALAAEPPEVRERLQLLLGDGHQCGRWYGPRSFDVVLCHGVLMYLPDPDPLLASLARVLAPGGVLSLLVRNGEALAMRAGLAGDWRAALGAFDSTRYTNRLGLPARADRLADLAVTLGELSVPVREWYGVRVFTDAMPDHAVPVDGRQLAQLLDAEDRAGRADPYRQVAALLHVIATK